MKYLLSLLAVFFGIIQSCNNDFSYESSLNSNSITTSNQTDKVSIFNTSILVDGIDSTIDLQSLHLEFRKKDFINAFQPMSDRSTSVNEYYQMHRDTWLSGRVGEAGRHTYRYKYELPKLQSSGFSIIHDLNNGPNYYVGDYFTFYGNGNYSYPGFDNGHYSVVHMYWTGDNLTGTIDESFVVDTFTVGTPAYILTLLKNGNGSISKESEWTSYFSNETERVTATPTSGWSFKKWTGDAFGTNTTLNLTMNNNKTVMANFWNVSISGPYCLDPGQIGTYTAIVNGSSNPTFQWFVSYKAQNGSWGPWNSLPGYTATQLITMGSQLFRVKVKVFELLPDETQQPTPIESSSIVTYKWCE